MKLNLGLERHTGVYSCASTHNHISIPPSLLASMIEEVLIAQAAVMFETHSASSEHTPFCESWPGWGCSSCIPRGRSTSRSRCRISPFNSGIMRGFFD